VSDSLFVVVVVATLAAVAVALVGFSRPRASVSMAPIALGAFLVVLVVGWFLFVKGAS
jgi:hypothetical protein